MNTGATTRVLMIPCSSPVYPKQEVVLQNGAHDSWRISIRKRHLCLDNQRCCTLDRAYPHIITQLATSRQKRIITCTRIAGKWGKPWWNWRGGGIQPHTCAIITNLEPQSGMTSTYVLQQCIAYSNHTVTDCMCMWIYNINLCFEFQRTLCIICKNIIRKAGLYFYIHLISPNW